MNKKANNFFLIFVITYLALSVLLGLVMRMANVPTWASMAIPELLLLLPGFVYIKVCGIDVANSLPVKNNKISQVFISLLIGYMLLPVANFLSALSMLFSTNYVTSSVNALSQYPLIVNLIVVALIPAVVEEFIFRGLFYHSYRKNGILSAVLMSALIFGCFHMNINQFMYTFVLGIVFALIVEATGSIYTSMAAHFTLNSYSVIMVAVLNLIAGSKSGFSDAVAETSGMGINSVTIVVYGIQAIINLTIIFFIVRAMSKRNHRWNYLVTEIKKGFNPQNGEKTWSWSAIAAVVICAAVMFFLR